MNQSPWKKMRIAGECLLGIAVIVFSFRLARLDSRLHSLEEVQGVINLWTFNKMRAEAVVVTSTNQIKNLPRGTLYRYDTTATNAEVPGVINSNP